MGPYSDGFRTELAARGYEPSSAAGQLQVMAHLSRWLVDRGLDEHALTSSVVAEFLRARRVAGYRQWLSARGIAPLLDHLREVGIAPVCSPAMADSVVEVLLAGYRAYLIEERGWPRRRFATTSMWRASSCRSIARRDGRTCAA